MILELIALVFGPAILGGLAVYLALRPKLQRLNRLTDRDARGRFVKREVGK